MLPKILSRNGTATSAAGAAPSPQMTMPPASASPYVGSAEPFDPGFDLLLIFEGQDWQKRRGLVVGDRFKVKGRDEFHLLSDLRRVDDRVWLLAVDSPSTLRDWDSFSGSVRSVVFSALFQPGGDMSGLFKNAIYGALIVAIFVLVIQINSMSGRFADIGGQLSQIQAQLAAPVEIRVR